MLYSLLITLKLSNKRNCTLSIPLIIISFIDDFKNIKIRYRLIAQIITSIVLISIGNIYSFEPSFIGLIIYLFLILISMTTINMTNFIDGLDGLLAGCMLLIITTSSIHLNITSPLIIIILGSLFCFLIFNFHPAKIFMGDVGSIFLGCIFRYSFSIQRYKFLFAVLLTSNSSLC